MVHFTAKKIGDKLVAIQAIQLEDLDIYIFGLEQGMHLILNIGMFLSLGLFLKQIWESLFFMVFFIPLRRFSGGYHAKTRARCYISSFLMCLIILLYTKYGILNLLIRIVVFSLFTLILFIFAPSTNIKNPTNNTEKIRYRKYALLIFLCESLVLFIAWILNLQILELTILTTYATVTCLILTNELRKWILLNKKNCNIAQ